VPEHVHLDTCDLDSLSCWTLPRLRQLAAGRGRFGIDIVTLMLAPITGAVAPAGGKTSASLLSSAAYFSRLLSPFCHLVSAVYTPSHPGSGGLASSSSMRAA
jgi:hypothetical protein